VAERLEVIRELVALAVKWESAGKEDLAHHALDVAGRLADQAAEDGEGQPCPKCGEAERHEDTGTKTSPRMTCLRCGHSWNPRETATDG
jgi:hypothetical protein